MITKQEQLIDRNDTQQYISMLVKIHIPLTHVAIAYAYWNVMLSTSYLASYIVQVAIAMMNSFQ